MDNNKNNDSWMSMGGVKTHATTRIIVAALIFSAYYLSQNWGWLAPIESRWADYFAMGAAVYAVASYLWAWREQAPSRTNLTITLVLDITLVTVASVLLGPFGPALFPLYLALVFAYGIPNGEYHLQIAAGFSSLAFSTVYVVNPWWNDPILAASLLLSLFFLPLMMAARLPESVAHASGRADLEETQSKADALTELSQELHTQISEVITSSEGLLKQRDMSPRKKRLTRSIADSSASALRLVKEVDEYARLSSGQHEYDKRPTSLIRILNKVRHQVTDEADKKCLNYEVIFQTPMLRHIEACPTEIRRVLEHLVLNAIKYTEQGFVRVTVKEESRNGSLVWRFEVADSGAGIDDPEQDSVFEPFVRTHAGRVHENRGIGLGTTIARQLVDGMNGSIGMDSEINSGSTFWFEVPVERTNEPDLVTDAPSTFSCLSLSAKEKTLLDKMEANGLISASHVIADDFPDQSSETADCLVVGENVVNQQFIQVLDTVSQGNEVPPVLRFQRLQPDNMVIYSRQKGGDMFFLPTSVSEEQLGQLLNQLGTDTSESSEEPGVTKEKLSVLIADGSNVSRDILATMLVNRGHQIYMARSPIQALDILSGINLDLMLLDPTLADEKVLAGIEHCQEKGKPLKCLLLGERPSNLSAQLEPHLYGEIPRPFKSSVVYEKIETLFGLVGTHTKVSEQAETSMRNMLFANDPALMDNSILDELEKVDSGNVLVNRFIQRYCERSRGLQQELNKACSAKNYQNAVDVISELAKGSEQIGLNQLAGFCNRLKSVQEADFDKKWKAYPEELGQLLDQSIEALQSYNAKTNRS